MKRVFETADSKEFHIFGSWDTKSTRTMSTAITIFLRFTR